MARLIAFDSCLFIYNLEQNPQFFKKTQEWLRHIGREPTVVSALVYTETLAKLKDDAFVQAKRMLDELSEYMTVCPMDVRIATMAAELRATHGSILKTADAIHLATALRCGATTLVTNDKELASLRVPGLRIMTLR